MLFVDPAKLKGLLRSAIEPSCARKRSKLEPIMSERSETRFLNPYEYILVFDKNE
jgi:hypothetical protein